MKDAYDVSFSRRFLHPRYWPTWVLLLICYLISWLPVSARHALGRCAGSQIYNNKAKRKHIVLTNLSLAFPNLNNTELEQASKEHLQWYMCALVDYCFFFFASKQRLYNMIEFEGHEHIEQAFKHKQNVMILLGHSVFLEFLPVMLGKFYNTYGSFKPLANPVIDWMIARSRFRHAEAIIEREAGLMRLVRELKNERLLVFLPDEDHGIEHSDMAPFFEHQKATLNTPARIAKLTKAVRLPAMGFFDPNIGKYKAIVGAPIDIDHKAPLADQATAMNKGLESLIEQYPTQYMWVMRLYKTQRPPHTNPYKKRSD